VSDDTVSDPDDVGEDEGEGFPGGVVELEDFDELLQAAAETASPNVMTIDGSLPIAAGTRHPPGAG